MDNILDNIFDKIIQINEILSKQLLRKIIYLII